MSLDKSFDQKPTISSEQIMDPEKGICEPITSNIRRVDDAAAVEASTGWLGKFVKVATKLRAEERGIERVSEADRSTQSLFDGFTLWASANFTYVLYISISSRAFHSSECRFMS
jgi:hypothetical protein